MNVLKQIRSPRNMSYAQPHTLTVFSDNAVWEHCHAGEMAVDVVIPYAGVLKVYLEGLRPDQSLCPFLPARPDAPIRQAPA